MNASQDPWPAGSSAPKGTPPPKSTAPPKDAPPKAATPGPAPWPEPPPPAPPAPTAPAAGAAPAAADDRPLLDRVIDALKTCYDPEIPLNIYDLSLIYGVDVSADGNVQVKMTLTSPSCPVAGSLPGEVQQKLAGLPGVRSAHVELVWDPPWDLSRLSEAARLTLGIG